MQRARLWGIRAFSGHGVTMRATFKLAAAIALGTLPLTGWAQDVGAAPNYGEVTLDSGFSPDPLVVTLSAGGNLRASSAADTCKGFITNKPDLRIAYKASSLPLIISVSSTANTTLVVNGPDGAWHCDDDGGLSGSNPAIRFNTPLTGRYEIWVGTYQSGGTEQAKVYVSEVSSQ